MTMKFLAAIVCNSIILSRTLLKGQAGKHLGITKAMLSDNFAFWVHPVLERSVELGSFPLSICSVFLPD